jgi:hypothetical protein
MRSAEAAVATRPRPVVVLGLVVALAVPLAVAVAALRRPTWFPVLDLAMTELRLRDVPTGDIPLVGLVGRIGSIERQGSHPGPLSFYALWPAYELFGARAWSMQAATAVLHLTGAAGALLVARRRGGVPLLVAVAAVLAVLLRYYGPGLLTEPWNPYLPLVWWVLLLLAVWSVVCGDLVLLPVVAVAGSLCAQTHVPYAGLVGGLWVLTVVAAVVHSRRAPPGAARWWLLAGAVLVVAWLPPVLDQLVHDPGNLRLLWDHFTDPPEDAVGLRRGAEALLVHLDPWPLVGHQEEASGSLVDPTATVPDGPLAPGLALLVLEVAAAAGSLRLPDRRLRALHLVLGVALVLALVALSRVFGPLWYYLALWARGLTALIVLAMVWTAVAAVAPWRPATAGLRRVATAALVLAVAAPTAALTVDAADAGTPAPRLSAAVGEVIGPTVRALDERVGPATGLDGRYLVTWTDAAFIGSEGFALVNELERRGFDVGVLDAYRTPGTRSRVRSREDATAVVQLATGVHVERWEHVDGAVEVARFDPRSPAERVEHERLRTTVIEELRAARLDDLLVDVDENLFRAAIDERVPPPTRRHLRRMVALGVPVAVFVAPPEASDGLLPG